MKFNYCLMLGSRCPSDGERHMAGWTSCSVSTAQPDWPPPLTYHTLPPTRGQPSSFTPVYDPGCTQTSESGTGFSANNNQVRLENLSMPTAVSTIVAGEISSVKEHQTIDRSQSESNLESNPEAHLQTEKEHLNESGPILPEHRPTAISETMKDQTNDIVKKICNLFETYLLHFEVKYKDEQIQQSVLSFCQNMLQTVNEQNIDTKKNENDSDFSDSQTIECKEYRKIDLLTGQIDGSRGEGKGEHIDSQMVDCKKDEDGAESDMTVDLDVVVKPPVPKLKRKLVEERKTRTKLKTSLRPSQNKKRRLTRTRFLRTNAGKQNTEGVKIEDVIENAHNEVKVEVYSHVGNYVKQQNGEMKLRRKRGRPSKAMKELMKSMEFEETKKAPGAGLITKEKRFSVNRNQFLHMYHKKCSQKPIDLDEEGYSASQKGFYCEDCGFLFTKMNKLIMHKKIKRGGVCAQSCIFCDAEENKEVFRCSKCPKVYETQELLDRHLQRHDWEIFSCKHCPQYFYTIPDLNTHTKLEHSDIGEKYLCDLCGSKFKEKKILVGHRKFVHSEERPHQCRDCGMKFKNKSQLNNHTIIHVAVEQRNLSCEVCGKMFVRSGTLRDHVRRHKKDFSIFCEVCKKGFYRRGALDEHMRTHTGDKPFTCAVCGYKCALSCNLTKHIRTHRKHSQPGASTQYMPDKPLYQQTYIPP